MDLCSVFICYLNELQKASIVAVAWAGPKIQASSLSQAKTTAVAAEGVVAQDWQNVHCMTPDIVPGT